MTGTEKKPIWKNELVWLFLITSGLFAVLYSKFIFSGFAYVFTDGGADTMQINYAQYGLFSSLFRSGENGYGLQAGLGMDLSSYYPAYLIPYNLLILLVPQRLLPWAVLGATYLKLMTISLVGYLFYRKLMGAGVGTMAAALAWTFSGYVILWGQHYGFCTCMALFTVFMYFLQSFLDGENRWKNAGLVLTVTMLLFSSYYFLYMIAFFSVAYVITYSVMKKRSLKNTAGKMVGLGGMGILGVLIGGTALVPIADTFLESARASAVSGDMGYNLLKPYEERTLGTIAARFFSNQMLGIEKDYTGNLNYYEGIVLAVSILTIFAVSYFIIKKTTRVRTLVVTALLIFLIVMPFTSRVLVFTPEAHRWSFMICFAEALVIGLFLQDVFRERDLRNLVKSNVLAVVLYVIMLAYIYSVGSIEINNKSVVGVSAFFLLYMFLLPAGTKISKMRKILPTAVLAVLVCELFVLNYPSLWHRESPTRNQVATEYYNDGTKAAADYLKEQDDSLYRVEKTYESASENDGMGQGYNGLSVYMSTNPASLVSYHKLYGPESQSVNFVDFNMFDYIRSALLGAKYLIANEGYQIPQKVYAPVAEAGGKTICESRYTLPFGYLYDKKWDAAPVENMSDLDKTLVSLSGFYYTNVDEKSDYENAVLPKSTDTSLMPYVSTAYDCTMEKNGDEITVRDLGDDPNIIFPDVKSCFDKEDRLYGISLTVDVSEDTEMAVYYQTEGDTGFSADKVYTFPITKENPTWEHLMPGGITALRVDVSTKIDYASVQKFEVKAYNPDECGYTALKNSGVEEAVFHDSTYQAQVTNDGKQNKMLCVPLFYQKGWSARIDGDVAEVSNINSGLCGVEIPSGIHQVVLEYRTPYKNCGTGMTVCGIVIFVIVFPGMAFWRRKRNK